MKNPASTKGYDLHRLRVPIIVEALRSTQAGALVTHHHYNSEMPKPGDVVAGRYEIDSIVGRGGGGVVYLARQLGINRDVALKVLPPDRHLQPAAVRRFEREARLVSRLRHPNTVTLYEFNRTQSDLLYIVMEFVEGVSLKEVLKDEPHLDPPRAIHIVSQILKSLSEAHSMGIVHRDLKPANIMLCSLYGERDYVKVLDFGVATVLEQEHEGFKEDMTTTADVVGTPKYMAPEQFRSEVLSPASDLYSVGCLAFEMLAGYCPFDGETLHVTIAKHLFQPPPELPEFLHTYPVLVQIIHQLLQKQPAERYQTATEVLQILSSWQSGAFGESGQYSAFSAPEPYAASSVGYAGGAQVAVPTGGWAEHTPRVASPIVPGHHGEADATALVPAMTDDDIALPGEADELEYEKTTQYSINDFLARIDGEEEAEPNANEAAPTDFFQALTGHGDDSTSQLTGDPRQRVRTGPTPLPGPTITPNNPISAPPEMVPQGGIPQGRPQGRQPNFISGPYAPPPSDKRKPLLFALIGGVVVLALVAVLLLVMGGGEEGEASAGDAEKNDKESGSAKNIDDPLESDPENGASGTANTPGDDGPSPELLAAQSFASQKTPRLAAVTAVSAAVGTKVIEKAQPEPKPEPRERKKRKPRKSYVSITVSYLPRNAKLKASNGKSCSNGASCRIKAEKGESITVTVEADGYGTIKKTVEADSSKVLPKIYLKRKRQ